MSKKVQLHVGSIEEMGARFVRAWRRLEKGEQVRETHLTFPDLEGLLSALTPKRLELLRDLHRAPARSVRALAERLGRDYKRVHEDVETLAGVGLLSHEGGAVAAPYDSIRAELRL